MSSTEELVQEHHVIERVLHALDRQVRRSREIGEVPVDFLRKFVLFSRIFIESCHAVKEERCLFPCLEVRGIPREGGPIGVMLMEHETIRALVRRISEALDLYDGGAGGVEEVLEPCQRFHELLTQHIFKENNILFPMGDGVMTGQDHKDNLRCYDEREEEIGHGEHERMKRLAEEMAVED